MSYNFYEFGPFLIDPVKRRLLRDGRLVALTPKCFETLLALVERRGEVVRKDDLMTRLWPDTAVEENNLTQQVSTLRKALGERACEHRYVVTVPGRGYSFVAEVRETRHGDADLGSAQHSGSEQQSDAEQQSAIEQHADDAQQADDAQHAGARVAHDADADQPALTSRDGSALRSVATLRPESAAGYRAAVAATVARGRGTRAAVFSVSIFLVGLALLAFWLSARGVRPAGDGAQRRSLAVLPFRSIGGGPADDYLGAGMTDTLIAKLSNVRQIAVRPSSAVMKYAGESPDPRAVGRELGVESVLEGTVQKAGERVRVTVQLVGARDGGPLWAQSFDEKMSDIFTLQDAISEQVARTVLVRLNGDERRRLMTRETESVEAYQSYLRGRFFWNRRNEESLRKSVEHFNRAIALDPAYARAYAGLADSYIVTAYYGRQSAAAYESARAAALKALELDESQAEAHTSLALIKVAHDQDDAGAEAEFKRALELNPDYATAHHWYSEYLATVGREPEALAEIVRAQQLDPLSPIINTTVGERLFYARRYDEAVAQLNKTLELAPDFGPAHYALGCVYEQKGMYREAIEQMIKSEGGGSIGTNALASLGHAYAVAGRKGEARRILGELLAERSAEPYSVALVYQGLGERQKAFDWLRKIQDKTCELRMLLHSDPRLDGLRSDPRFQEISGA